MPAYVIADIESTDESEYHEYIKLARPTILQRGGRFLTRGLQGQRESLQGGWLPQRIVVLEFPSYDQAKQWWESEEYRAARVIRERCARSRILLVDGATSQPTV